MRVVACSLVFLAVLVARPVWAVDHRSEALSEAAPGELSAEIRAQLSPTGVRVTRGAGETLCDIWLSKELATKTDFTPTAEVLYPLTPGQLIGAVRFARGSYDFRDQQIGAGVYTLRYALQPVDGAHVGTSLTRDFLLLVRAADDPSAAVMEMEPLVAASIEAAGTSHPNMLSLQRPVEPAAAGSAPAMREDAPREWWIVVLNTAIAGGGSLPIEIVVVGKGEV
jgi:hypothetical protein